MSSDLRDKMPQWECRPPGEAWNRISTSLDADDEYVVSRKLSSFQSQPPGHIWNHIEAGLNEQEPGRFVSFYQQHKRIFQYTGAAAVLIFLAVLTSLFVTNQSAPNELTEQSSIIKHHQKRIIPSSDNENTSIGKINPQDSHPATRSIQPNVSIENDHSVAKQSSATPNNRKAGTRYNALVSQWQQAKDSLVNRYFVHTNKNGEPVRFSNKLYGLFECSDEWTERECAQQIKLWQQRAATSSMFASADFTGVLEVLKGMQEHQ